MNSSKLIIVAIAVIIGLALTPVVAQQTGVLTADPGCATGSTPRRVTAAIGALSGSVAGNVVCSTAAASVTSGAGVTAPAFPSTPGGRFNALYAGTAANRTTVAPSGTFQGAGGIIELIPLVYIAGILFVPVGMLGKKMFKKM